MFNKKWDQVLKEEVGKDYFFKLMLFLKDEYAKKVIFPEAKDIFNAFKYTDYDQVKVVILGQDPYHNPNQAHGLAFSVQEGCKLPPSLENIYDEVKRDLGINMNRKNGNLQAWAKQGVFLLNAVLTVEMNKPKSHAHMGWETFTDFVIQELNKRTSPIVFMLWGNDAIAKSKFIDSNRHLVLKTTHPSPLSCYRGFNGCGHFSQANKFLEEKGLEPIDWSIK